MINDQTVTRFADLTRKPALFRKTYWGTFDADKNPDFLNKSIIANRNRFAEEFMVLRYHGQGDLNPYNACSTELRSLFDHCELYKCFNGYVFIVSPYRDDLDSAAKKIGMIPYRKLYHSTATTYLITFRSKVDFNRWAKSLGK